MKTTNEKIVFIHKNDGKYIEPLFFAIEFWIDFGCHDQPLYYTVYMHRYFYLSPSIFFASRIAGVAKSKNIGYCVFLVPQLSKKKIYKFK